MTNKGGDNYEQNKKISQFYKFTKMINKASKNCKQNQKITQL